MLNVGEAPLHLLRCSSGQLHIQVSPARALVSHPGTAFSNTRPPLTVCTHRPIKKNVSTVYLLMVCKVDDYAQVVPVNTLMRR